MNVFVDTTSSLYAGGDAALVAIAHGFPAMKARGAPTTLTTSETLNTTPITTDYKKTDDGDDDLKKKCAPSFLPPTCGVRPKFDYTKEQLFKFQTNPGTLLLF